MFENDSVYLDHCFPHIWEMVLYTNETTEWLTWTNALKIGVTWTRVIYSVVITWQSNPHISQFNSPCNESTSVWSMFAYNIYAPNLCTTLNDYILGYTNADIRRGRGFSLVSCWYTTRQRILMGFMLIYDGRDRGFSWVSCWYTTSQRILIGFMLIYDEVEVSHWFHAVIRRGRGFSWVSCWYTTR